MREIDLTPTDPAVTAARESGRKLVERYLSIRGADRYEERLELMCDDVLYEIVNTMDCLPDRTCGKNKVRRRFEENAETWADFSYENISLIPTANPEVFLVECDARGTMKSPMHSDPIEYQNYYYIHVEVRDGKIRKFRQFSNPMKLMHDFWLQLPNTLH